MARKRFDALGFDAATLSGIASDAEISLAALYHYFDSKTSLYELVFRDTLTRTWDVIMTRLNDWTGIEATFTARLSALIEAIVSEDEPEGRQFLAAAPIEMLRHPQLGHLLQERDAMREAVFRSIVDPLLRERGIPSLGPVEDTQAVVRIAFAGWAMEAFFQPDHRDQLTNALVHIGQLLDAATEPVRPGAHGHPRVGKPPPKQPSAAASPSVGAAVTDDRGAGNRHTRRHPTPAVSARSSDSQRNTSDPKSVVPRQPPDQGYS